MKTASTLCLAAALVGGVSGQRLLQEVADLDFNVFSMGGAEGDQGGSSSADRLVRALEGDSSITVVGPVELGEFSCTALDNVEDASALSMTIHKERIVADKTSYTMKSAEDFTDGIGRHIWTGVVSEPGLAEDEAAARTVSLSWGDDCNVESFLLKITKRNMDGTASVTKTVPCIDATQTTCLVEVLAHFDEPGQALNPEDYGASGGNNAEPSGRRMQEGASEPENTVVDVMVLYTEQSQQVLGSITHTQMITYILESIIVTNQAFVNSQASVRFNLVDVGLAPFDEDSLDGVDTLISVTGSKSIKELRDTAQADLVQVYAMFDDGSCGWGWTFYNEAYGYSLVKPSCIDNFVHTHEFGHNMGCGHNRENSRDDTDYAHGTRYCEGLTPYRTVMSYSCGSPFVNYFSNPDVSYNGRPTGTDTEDNVRALEDNMVAVSNYRGMDVTPPTPTPTAPPTMMPTEPPTMMPTLNPTMMPTLNPTMMPTEPPTVPTLPPTMAPYAEVDPTPYYSVGCYKDSNRDRVLTGSEYKRDEAMTAERCGTLCEGSAYFGTEYSTECFCGPSTDEPKRKGPATCNFPCSGDAEEKCGGNNAISLYKYITYPLVGCFKDSRDRVLSGDDWTSGDMTTKVCADFCTGSTYFGTEYGTECFCSKESDDPMELGDATCDFECAGDATETCGGSFAISVYQYPDIVLTPTPTFLGCWEDSKAGRIMTNKQTDSGMTTDMCQGLCTAYAFFGTQYGVECWCGMEGTDYEVYGASSACDYSCEGDIGETCGGRNAMSVWEY